MFKTFAGKFFILYASIILIISFIFFSVVFGVINDHYIDIRQDLMIDESKNIAEQYKKAYIEKESSKVAFIYQLGALGKNVKSRILVLDKFSYVAIDSSKTGKSFVGDKIDLPFIRDSFNGNISKKTGDFNKYFDSLHLITSVPVKYDGEVHGVVVMLTPYPFLQNEVEYSYTILAIVAVVLLGITFISTFYFSKNISSAINILIESTKKIASGDFSTRIELNNSELKELSDNMNYMATELENLENLRKDFITNVSHDLRSPLTSIKGFVTALQDGTIVYEDKDKYLQIILDETDRLSKLTDDIMLLTKMENNVSELNITSFELKTVIKKACSKFERAILDKNQNLSLELFDKEVYVCGDLNKIQRVITNILDNAIKFTPSGGNIKIETSIIDEKAYVKISDTGIGISKDDINHIWHRFHKADKSRGIDKKGTGLGLAIVHEIIRAHKENITVESEIGVGTSFTFSVELAEA